MRRNKPRKDEWFYIQKWRADREKEERQRLLDSANFKVGDLVQIAPWCANKHRLAHVTEVAWYDTRNVTIQFLDQKGLKEEPSRAIEDNLILIDRPQEK